MACEQFLAPNGKPSLLYAALEQKYGADKALQMWSWSKSQDYQGKKKDVNGDPLMESVDSLYTSSVPVAGDKVLAKEDFNMSSQTAFNDSLNKIYAEAEANPGRTYTIPFTANDVVKFGKKKTTISQIAQLLDRPNIPSNVIVDKSILDRMQQLPARFGAGVQMAEANPLDLDPDSVQRQMDKEFVQIRDMHGNSTGRYFSPEKQSDVVDTIVYKFYNKYQRITGEDAVSSESVVGRIRQEIYDDFKKLQVAYQAQVGKRAEAELTANNLLDILRSYNHVDGNSFWQFAMNKLNAIGVKVNEKEGAPEGVIESAGQGLTDWSDSSLELDRKDTASTRMKLFLLSTVSSRFEDEVQPAQVNLSVANPETRRSIVGGLKKELVLSPDVTTKLGLSAADKLAKGLSQSDIDARTQRTTMIDGKLMRVTARGTITEQGLNKWTAAGIVDRINAEEGRVPAVGDVYLTVVPYVQQKGVLGVERNFFGQPKLADFESLWEDLTSLLANREPNLEGYLAALSDSVSPNIQRVLEKLISAPVHVQKEFTSVMSSHYQRQLMVLFTKGLDGHIDHKIIDSNRTSEVENIKKLWQENQKMSPILIRNGAGQTIINPEIASSLYEELQALYAEPTPMRSITANEAMARHGKDANRILAEEDKKVDSARAVQLQKKIDFFKKVMDINGISLNDKAVADLFTPKTLSTLTKGVSIQSLFGGFKDDGTPIGLVDTLVGKLFNNSRPITDDGEVQEDENEDAHEAYKANNPLYTEGTAMNILAKAQSKYTPVAYSQTHRSAEGKTIYSFGLNTALSHAIRKFKDSPAERARFENSHFAKRSWLLQQLNNDEQLRNKFQLTYVDGMKNEYGSRDGVSRTDMSDREQWLMALSYFQNKGGKLAHHVSMTHSDKQKSPVFMNVPRIGQVVEWNNGNPVPAQSAVELAYTHLFMAEYDRMLQPGGETIKGYEQGKKLYYIFPYFNQEFMRAMVKSKRLSAGEFTAIWKEDGTPQSVENKLFKETALKLIRMQMRSMVNETEKSWEKANLTEAGLPGPKNYYNTLAYTNGLSVQKDTYFAPDGTALTDQQKKAAQIKFAAADYTLNSLFVNASLAQLFYGDPALTFKNSLDGSQVEYGKRLAKDIAPGRDGEFSHSPKYITITAQDYKPIVKELSGIKGYETTVEATDAQELTTVEEGLNVRFAYGLITEKQLQDGLRTIREAKGGFYQFEGDLHNIIMQPTKPVAAGLRDAVDGVMAYDYVKSSAFDLYPPMTQGLELDHIRRAMEEDGIARLNFATAKKIGAPTKQVKLFDGNGKVIQDVFKSQEWAQDSRQTLDRTEFRIQQDVPYDEDKKAIGVVSQMNKLIVEKIPTIKTPFTYQGNPLSGTQLRKVKEGIRQQLIQQATDEFLDAVGAVREGDHYKFKDKQRLYDRLAQEAGSRSGYTMNDVMALQSYTKDKELTLPLFATPSASKFESLMMSMVQQIVKLKVPGRSFIQASPAGFKTMDTWENAKLDQSQIVWTAPFHGELSTASIGEDGEVVPAQILVGFNYFAKNRLDIKDFTIEQDGKKMIDVAKLPPELFQLVGARIPNQGHSSMLPIQIAGFLPESMGDMIVVPAAITRQMGADFDVDKLFTYNRGYNVTAEGLRPSKDLKNDYFDVHWSVLTHPEIFDSMMSPLDKKDAANEASILNPGGNNSVFYFSPSYQMNDFQSMKGAKVLVGMTSLSLTSNGVMEDKNITLGQFDKELKEWEDTSIDFGGVQLTHLSGYGQSEYNGEKRTKADNIQIQQSESVDHAKNRIIDKINLNPFTAAASLAMSRLQSGDKGKVGTDSFVPGEALSFDYNARLLMQPIIRDFADLMSQANDTLSTEFTSDPKAKVFETLHNKYMALAGMEPQGFPLLPDISKLNADQLLQAMEGNSKEHYLQQLALLNAFQKFDSIGTKLVGIQALSNQDTAGAGKDVLGVLNLMDKRNKLDNPSGGIDIRGTSSLYAGTEVGTTFDSTLKVANDLFTDELPYKHLQSTYDFLSNLSGKADLSNDTKKTVFNAMKAFVFTHADLGLFEDAEKERLRLLYSAGDRKSLAYRVLDAQGGWGKNNYFLQRLQTVIDPNGLSPDRLEYSASKASRLDDFENIRAWLGMLQSSNAEEKALGEDLLRYLYATGGQQNSRNFVKFIPWAAIEGSSIAEGLRTQFRDLKVLDKSQSLREQIVQHNPSMAFQLADKLANTGAEYETPPERFELPVANLDAVNPAQSMLRDTIGDDGKKYTSYPAYTSYRYENKWYLYKRTGEHANQYIRIDTLGTKEGIQEYKFTGRGQVRSVVPENRASWWYGNDPYENASLIPQQGGSVNFAAVMAQVGLKPKGGSEQDIMNSLSVISKDTQQPSHLRVIASALVEMEHNPAEAEASRLLKPSPLHYTVEPRALTNAGSFIGGRNILNLNPASMFSKKDVADTLIHEMAHYHSVLIATTLLTDEQMKAKGYDTNSIAYFTRLRDDINKSHEFKDTLNAVEEIRQEAFKHFKAAMINSKGQNYWDSVITKNQGEAGHLHYALSTTIEFIPHIFTNKGLINFLNVLDYKGNKTLIDKIKDVFAKFWNAILTSMGARKNSLLEEAVKRTMNLFFYDQAAIGRIESNAPSDFSAMKDIVHEKIDNREIQSVDKLIGKLAEQRQEIIASYTGVADIKVRADKRRKLDDINDDIERLKDKRDLALIPEIGKKQMRWVEAIDKKANPTANELMTAVKISSLWDSINEILHGESTNSTDPELATLAQNAGNVRHALLSKLKDYITTQSDGFLSNEDWLPKNLEDVSYTSGNIRSLSSAAKSKVIQNIANFTETTGRHENEDTIRLMNELTALQKDMLKHVGKDKKQLQATYDKLMQSTGWGLAQRYSSEWYNFQAATNQKRNAILRSIDAGGDDDITKARKKRTTWSKYWADMDSKAAAIDTNKFFDAETGKLKDNPAARNTLALKVGEQNVDRVIAEAQQKYLKYIEEKKALFELLDDELAVGDKTAEEIAQDKLDYQNRNSPNVFFSDTSQRSFSPSSDKFVTMVPKHDAKEFHNEAFAELMKDDKLKDFYIRYSNIINRLISYLPKSIQESVGVGFVPIVRKALMTEGMDVQQYINTFNERFTKSMTASEWQENMGDRAINRIPIEFTKNSDAEIGDRSKDLIGVARLFGMMALHYKHFSAAKDVIDMGETVLKEIDRTRMDGVSQVEQNGEIVTAKKGLRNALDALGYLKDYMVYRKPKNLQFSLGGKIYGEKVTPPLGSDEKTHTKFMNPLNPLSIRKQIMTSDLIKKLTAEKEALNKKYLEQEGDEAMTRDEYEKAVEVIDTQLNKYEGFTLYGSKIGDKIIGINQLKALSYNPFSAVANVGFGLISIAIHAKGGLDFNSAEMRKAIKMMTSATAAKFGMKNTTAEKIINTMDRLGVLGDFVDSKYGQAPELRDNKPAWKRILDPFGLMRTSDIFMKGVSTLAVLYNRKVEVTVDGEQKSISVWDALDNEGKWDESKYGKNPSWYDEDVTKQKDWDKLRNRLERVNMILHGNQSKNSPKRINQGILGRLLGQFRMSWLPEGWYSRFAGERYDQYLERDIKGRYKSVAELGLGGTMKVLGRQMLNLLPGVKMDIGAGIPINGKTLSDSAVDMDNMRRNFAELGWFLGLSAAVLMLKHIHDGDDDDEKSRSMMLLINQLIRGKQDIDFYASPGVFDAVTRNFIPATSVITDYTKAIKATARFIIDDDYEYDEWLKKIFKAGLPIPQATLIPKTQYMMHKDLESFQ